MTLQSGLSKREQPKGGRRRVRKQNGDSKQNGDGRHGGCAGWARRLSPFAGILFLWSIAGWDGLFRDFMKPTFWVYCLHMPLTAYFLSGPLFVFGKGDVSTFLIMLLMPWANLAFCLAAAHAARRFAPRVYALLTGGRG